MYVAVTKTDPVMLVRHSDWDSLSILLLSDVQVKGRWIDCFFFFQELVRGSVIHVVKVYIVQFTKQQRIVDHFLYKLTKGVIVCWMWRLVFSYGLCDLLERCSFILYTNMYLMSDNFTYSVKRHSRYLSWSMYEDWTVCNVTDPSSSAAFISLTTHETCGKANTCEQWAPSYPQKRGWEKKQRPPDRLEEHHCRPLSHKTGTAHSNTRFSFRRRVIFKFQTFCKRTPWFTVALTKRYLVTTGTLSWSRAVIFPWCATAWNKNDLLTHSFLSALFFLERIL